MLLKSDCHDLRALHWCHTFLSRKSNLLPGKTQFPQASHQKTSPLSANHSTSPAELVGLVVAQLHCSWCHGCEAEGPTEDKHLREGRESYQQQDRVVAQRHFAIFKLAPLSLSVLSWQSCRFLQWGPMSSTAGSRDHEQLPLKLIIDGFVSNTSHIAELF